MSTQGVIDHSKTSGNIFYITSRYRDSDVTFYRQIRGKGRDTDMRICLLFRGVPKFYGSWQPEEDLWCAERSYVSLHKDLLSAVATQAMRDEQKTFIFTGRTRR
jgi:hypothetical protein